MGTETLPFFPIHFLSFFPLPLFFVLAFFIFIAIVQRSAEGQKVFILTL